jgi:superfamily II DNA/RNA helicase
LHTVGSSEGNPQVAPTPASTTFAALGVPPVLVRELTRQRLTTPFPIQAATLPDTLAGGDVLGRGRTGSGKTLAFSLPLVARLSRESRQQRKLRPRGLVLVPTRELARQVSATLEPLARAAGLRTALVYGGVSQGPQVTALRRGVDIVIACPGRLEDLIGQGLCDLSAVEVTVLDEADHMADLGFLPPVRRLLDQTAPGGQRMLFSATLDNGVDVLVRRYLDSPLVHSVDTATAAPPAMSHHVLHVSREHKSEVVRELASGTGRSLLFTRTKHLARRLAKQLTAAGIPAVDLHGDLSQKARERNLAAFASGEVVVLTATDIAARGIHVDDVELVVHVDPPAEPKAYLHRSGRTARAGTTGTVVTLVTPDQRKDVAHLVRLAKIRPTTTEVVAGAPKLRELAGEQAPHRTPAVPAPVRRSATSRPEGHPSTPRRRSRGGRRYQPARRRRERAA